MATPHTLSLENAHSFGLRGSSGRVEDKTCAVVRSPSSLQAAPSSCSVYQPHMYTSPLVAAMPTPPSANFDQYWSTECQANSDIDISQFLTPQISGDDPATNSDTQDDFSSSSSPYSDSSAYTSVLWSDDAQSSNQNHILHTSLPASFSMSPRPFFSHIVSPQLKRDDFLESPIEFDDINIFSHSIQTPSSSPNVNLRSTPLMSRSPSFPIFPPTPNSFINSTFTFIARNNQTPSSHILESPSVSNNNANTAQSQSQSQYSENNNSPLSKSTSCLPPPALTNTPTLINIKNTLNNININTPTSSSNASPPHSSQNSPTPVRKRSPTTSPKISPKKKLSNNVNNNSNNNNNNNNSNIPSPLSLRKVLASSANNTPSTSPTLSSRTPKKNSLTEPSKNAIEDEPIKPCELKECPVCLRDPPSCLQSCTPSWAAILRIVFYSLKICNPSKDFFNLRSNVYDFVNTHWKKICMGKTRSDHWKKQLQDTLAHNKKLFVSGADIYKQKGFWKLDDLTDPWEIPSGGSSQNWSSPQTPPKQRKIMQRFPFPPPPLNLNSPATPVHHTFQPNNKAEFNNFLRNKKQSALEESDEEEIAGIEGTDWSENEDEIYNNSGTETATEHGSENSHDSENESETQTQSSQQQQQQQQQQSFNYTFPASIHIPHNVRSRKRVKLTYSM